MKRGSRWGQPGDDEPATGEPSATPTDAKRLAIEAAARLAAQFAPAPSAHAPPPSRDDEPIVERMGINHLSGPKRYRLTKRPTIDEVQARFGVAITVKGVFQPHDAPADPNNDPLYLELSGLSLSSVNAAMQFLRDLQLEEEDAAASFVGKVPIGIPGNSPFHPVAKIIGTGGENLKHIKRTANVQLSVCGRDCRAAENESDEELHMRIEAKSSDALARATALCTDLLAHIHEQYTEWQSRRPPPPPPPPPQQPPQHAQPYGGAYGRGGAGMGMPAGAVQTPEMLQYYAYVQSYMQQQQMQQQQFAPPQQGQSQQPPPPPPPQQPPAPQTNQPPPPPPPPKSSQPPPPPPPGIKL